MKKLTVCILCLLLLAALCLPAFAEEADPRTLADIMTDQVSDEVLAILSNPAYYREQDAFVLKNIDVKNSIILYQYHHSLVSLGTEGLDAFIAAREIASPTYYVIDLNTNMIRTVRINRLSTYQVRWIESYEERFPSNPYLNAILDSTNTQILLCGKQREVLALYPVTEASMTALLFVTTDGTFVQFYPSYEDPPIDMTMEEYSAWVDAYSDFKEFYQEEAYLDLGDDSINTLGKVMLKYGTPTAVYTDMEAIQHAKDVKDMLMPFVAIFGIVLLLGVIVFLSWRRTANRKKYNM